MSLRRLTAKTPVANTNTFIFKQGTPYFSSVIATNRNDIKTASIDVYIVPDGETNPDNYVYIVYKFPLEALNTLETHRFAMDANDSLYIRSTLANVSFLLEGIPQPEIEVNYLIQDTFPPTPGIGQLCYRTDTDILYVYKPTGWKAVTTA